MAMRKMFTIDYGGNKIVKYLNLNEEYMNA